MLKNYIRIAWRNITKARFYSFVNIIGLSTAIAFTLVIAAYAWSLFQVNKNLKHANRQYILTSKWKDPNQGYDLATLGQLAKALKDNYPNLVANYYRYDGITSTVSKGEKSFRETMQVGDSTMLTMYGFSLLQGDVKTALNGPFTVVITKEKAIKYFGKPNVVGETVTIESFSGSKHDFLITGVLNTLPANSVTTLTETYPGHFFVSTDNLTFFGRDMNWQNAFIVNYVELKEGVTPKDLEEPIAYLQKQHTSSQFVADLKIIPVALSDYYLSANNGLVRKMIYALSAIALFILAMAIINFINMSVSRSAARMREMGIRKVVGGLKRQLIVQFLTESIILVAFAMLAAFIIYITTKDLFSSILGREIPSLNKFPAYFIAFPFIFTVIIGFIAGIYPAFILSSLNSIESLKGKLSVKENVLFRKSLIAFQFVTATIAFTGAIIITKQIDLFLKSDLGYNKDYILSAQVPRNWSKQGANKMISIRNELAAIPKVNHVSLSYEVPDGNNSGSASLYRFGADSTSAVTAQALTTDENYLKVYSMQLKAGSYFEGHALDSGKMVINEAAIHALGFKDASDAVGKQVRVINDPTIFTIKGVTNDFHFGSMQQRIAPIAIFNVQFATIYRYLSFKINPANIPATISALQSKWNVTMPGAAFEYKFMDDTLFAMYQTEIQLKKAAYTATVLALIIVLLGVIGLISLSIQKRTKEIGIRKILGASVSGIVLLFLKEFLAVMALGALVACPLAYMIMNNWLQNYAYRIDITATPFIIAMVILVLVTALLICAQTIKSALLSPVKNLRTE
ncbi:ABC transporter permease [Niastella sp. OAS944]|uniref:ABC transporter permease n=1 Tax=Niastella sp. OAS944 TaxID=2664089 RepID=UPI0034978F91|nr:ABC-type antimicrobial peptide transport system permease subunit [Chitinophagaceae bacterium OAS944]